MVSQNEIHNSGCLIDFLSRTREGARGSWRERERDKGPVPILPLPLDLSAYPRFCA